eukprot:ctg_3596.g568
MKLSPAGTETNNGREAGVAVLDASWVGESEVRGALLGKRPADEEAVRDAAVRSEAEWARCHWEELLRETESRSPRASKRQRVQGQRDERQGEQVQTLAPGRDEKMAPEATSESMEDASVDLSFDTEEAVSDLHSFGGEGNAQFGLLASPGTTNDEVPLNVLHSPPQPSGGFQTGTGKALQAHQGSAMLLQRLFGDAPAVSDAHVPAAAAPSGFRSGGGAQLQASARAAERVHCLFADDRSDTGAAQEPPRPAADTPEQDIFVDAAMRAPPPARASRWTAAFRQPRKSVSRTRCLPRTAPTARPTAPTLPRMSPDAVPRQSPPPPPIPAVTSCRQPRCPRAAFTPDEAHRFVFTGARLDFAALLRACGETEAYAGMLRHAPSAAGLMGVVPPPLRPAGVRGESGGDDRPVDPLWSRAHRVAAVVAPDAPLLAVVSRSRAQPGSVGVACAAARRAVRHAAAADGAVGDARAGAATGWRCGALAVHRRPMLHVCSAHPAGRCFDASHTPVSTLPTALPVAPGCAPVLLRGTAASTVRGDRRRRTAPGGVAQRLPSAAVRLPASTQ